MTFGHLFFGKYVTELLDALLSDDLREDINEAAETEMENNGAVLQARADREICEGLQGGNHDSLVTD